MELLESKTKSIKKAIIDPKSKDPVSPRNTFFEALKLWPKKPIRAPIIIGKKRNISLSETRRRPPTIKKNLITTIKTNIEIKNPNHSGISKIPKTP